MPQLPLVTRRPIHTHYPACSILLYQSRNFITKRDRTRLEIDLRNETVPVTLAEMGLTACIRLTMEGVPTHTPTQTYGSGQKLHSYRLSTERSLRLAVRLTRLRCRLLHASCFAVGLS